MLAEGRVGRGHASRSLLHTLKQGTVMHDASYWGPLQLTGSLGNLWKVLAATRYKPAGYSEPNCNVQRSSVLSRLYDAVCCICPLQQHLLVILTGAQKGDQYPTTNL